MPCPSGDKPSCLSWPFDTALPGAFECIASRLSAQHELIVDDSQLARCETRLREFATRRTASSGLLLSSPSRKSKAGSLEMTDGGRPGLPESIQWRPCMSPLNRRHGHGFSIHTISEAAACGAEPSTLPRARPVTRPPPEWPARYPATGPSKQLIPHVVLLQVIPPSEMG